MIQYSLSLILYSSTSNKEKRTFLYDYIKKDFEYSQPLRKTYRITDCIRVYIHKEFSLLQNNRKIKYNRQKKKRKKDRKQPLLYVDFQKL